MKCTGPTHHCAACNKIVSKKCWQDGHIACCEARSCSKTFNAYHGCLKHPYSDAWNLAAKAKYQGESLGQVIAKRNWELQGPPDLRNASVGEKLAALRKKYKHHELEEAKPQRKQPESKPKVDKHKKFITRLDKRVRSCKF